ncbi:MAG: 50S ribosomal protein L16 [Candidatus Diapherotrites archaeon]
MGLRPGHCYRSLKDRPWTRVAVKVHRRNYIGATPGVKTRQWNMGNGDKAFSHILDLIVDEGVQIRDNAIESSRISINRYLTKHLGKDGFFFKIRVYPHQILRENKQAQGAHADRIQKGMSHPFGKPVGRAIRVRPGQKIISLLVDEKDVKIGKEGLLRAKSRITCKLHVLIHTDVESIGTKPTKTIRDVKTEAEDKADAADAKVAADAEKAESAVRKETGKEGAKEDAKSGEKKEEPKSKEKK